MTERRIRLALLIAALVFIFIELWRQTPPVQRRNAVRSSLGMWIAPAAIASACAFLAGIVALVVS